MPPKCLGSTHQLRSGAARLVRLAAVTCLALAAGSAAVWAQTTGDSAAGHRCMHDELQQRVLQSVAQEHNGRGTLSAVGLPVVAADSATTAEDGGVDYARADSGTPLQVVRSADWGELRITVSTGSFTDTERYCTHAGQESITDDNGGVICEEEDILTEEKRDILMNSIIPEALRLHTDRLKVRQVQDTWKVTGKNSKICGLFKVPEAHLTNGVNNTDFLLYLTSAPSDIGAVAWGAICQVFPDGQPAVGVINVPAAVIVSRYDQRVIRMVAHQIAHALGFSEDFFQSAGITKLVDNIRGMPGHFTVINGSTTVKKAREHYNCSTLEHLEMDFHSSTDFERSHIKMRNAKDELMTAVVGTGYYSALTMAIFEDMGFYQVDFSKAEVLQWGHKIGCDFFNNKCMESNITQWPQMFCNRTKPEVRCTSSRLEVGECGVYLHDSPLDEYYRYFTNESLGGGSIYMDFCPYVEYFIDGSCNQNNSTAPEALSAFNVFSDAARCIDGAFTPKNRSTDSRPTSGMCANVRCDNTTKTYSIQVKGSSAYVSCTPGKSITLDTISDAFEAGSYITCPPYVEVCQGNLEALNGGAVDIIHPRGNGAAGLHSARTLVSAGVALLVMTLTVGLSA